MIEDKQAHEMAEQAGYAKSVLDVLLAAMQSDCPPGNDAVQDTIFAVRTLLEKR